MIPSLVLAAVFVSLQLVAWATFRLDKAFARRGRRRIRERTLLLLAGFGGLGALAAMYLHRHRHKVDKRRFAATAWLLAVLGLAAFAFLGYQVLHVSNGVPR